MWTHSVKWLCVPSLCQSCREEERVWGHVPWGCLLSQSSAQVLHLQGCRRSRVRQPGQHPAAKILPILPAFPVQGSVAVGREDGWTCRKALASPATSDRAIERAERLRIVPLPRGLPPLHLFTTHPVFFSVCFTHHRLH